MSNKTFDATKGVPQQPVLTNIYGVNAPPATTFGKGARNGDEVLDGHRVHEITEWRDRNRK